jgi:hypothetical protein
MLLADVRFEPPHQKEKNALALVLCALLLTVRFRQRSSPQCGPKHRPDGSEGNELIRRGGARQGKGTLGVLWGGGARVLYDANDTGRRDFVVEGRRGLNQWDSNDVGARPTCATAMAPNRPQQSTRLPKGLPLTGWRRQMSALWRSNLASYMTIECPIIELLPSSIRVLSI